MTEKQDLKSLTRSQLTNWFQKQGFKAFRAQQVFNWLYKNGVSSFTEMKNLPRNLQQKLNELSYLTDIKLVEQTTAADGTDKFLWQLKDGELIESVHIPASDRKRHTACVSTQVGCAQGCKFCATGLMGLSRNLSSGEIIDQVLKVQKQLGERISNVVFMGMGEPFQNYDNLLRSINILNDEQGLNIGSRRMTISTAGYLPGIRKLSRDNEQIGLAISLNAPNDRLRDRLMPINKKYPLAELMAVVRDYIQKTGRRVTFEYVLISEVNDKPSLAEELIKLLQGIMCHINLIPVNPVPELEVDRPSEQRVRKFLQILISGGMNATIRQEQGTDIQAACGQLKNDRG